MSERPRAHFKRQTWMRGVALAAFSAGALIAAGAMAADAPAKSASAKAAPARKAAAKKAGSFDFGNWSSYLGSGSSSQFSALTQINKSNVKQLQVAWTWNAGDG